MIKNKLIFMMAFVITIMSSVTSCGDIDKKVNKTKSTELSSSSKDSTLDTSNSPIEKDLNIIAPDELLAENNSYATVIQLVSKKALNDLQNQTFEGVDYKFTFSAGEYRFSIDTKAELPQEIKYSTNGGTMSEDQTEGMLKYIIGQSGEIDSGEVYIVITEQPDFSIISHNAEDLKGDRPYIKTYPQLAIQVFYSDNNKSSIIGCSSPNFNEASDFTIDNIPNKYKEIGDVLKWYNQYNAEEVQIICQRALEDLRNNKFSNIQNISDITPGDYLIKFSEVKTTDFKPSDDSKNGILSYDDTQNWLEYVLSNPELFNKYHKYYESELFNDGIALVKIYKGTEYYSEFPERGQETVYVIYSFYADSLESTYLGNSGYNKNENYTNISSLPFNEEEHIYTYDKSASHQSYYTSRKD